MVLPFFLSVFGSDGGGVDASWLGHSNCLGLPGSCKRVLSFFFNWLWGCLWFAGWCTHLFPSPVSGRWVRVWLFGSVPGCPLGLLCFPSSPLLFPWSLELGGLSMVSGAVSPLPIPPANCQLASVVVVSWLVLCRCLHKLIPDLPAFFMQFWMFSVTWPSPAPVVAHCPWLPVDYGRPLSRAPVFWWPWLICWRVELPAIPGPAW